MKTTGMVLGKFCPLHLGHKYLLSTALSQVDTLYVVIDGIMDSVFPLVERERWLKEEISNATILSLKKTLPQFPEETPLFWEIWKKELTDILPEKIDFIFASETYGERLAEELSAKFVCVDIHRKKVPVSGTMIRNSVYQNWNFLTNVVKRYFGIKICVVGPESTGKTTISRGLSDYFKAPLVSEYAETLIREQKGHIKAADMDIIIERHQNDIDSKLALNPPLTIIDTDAIMSKIWSDELFSYTPVGIESFISRQKFDLYLLMGIDLDWEDDVHRFKKISRQHFFYRCCRELEAYNRNYIIIEGKGEKRFETALLAVNEYMKLKGLTNHLNDV